jgi:hypothetical protein
MAVEVERDLHRHMSKPLLDDLRWMPAASANVACV